MPTTQFPYPKDVDGPVLVVVTRSSQRGSRLLDLNRRI